MDSLDNLLTAAIPNTAWQGQNGIVAVYGIISRDATLFSLSPKTAR